MAIWIIVPVFVTTMGCLVTTIDCLVTTMGCLMTDVVKGMCVPWGVYSSYAAEKAMTSVMVSFTFLVPLILMVFSYSRIVHKMRNKVSLIFI